MKNRNKYIQKNKGTNIVDTILDSIGEWIPAIKEVIPNSKALKTKAKESAIEYVTNQVKSATVGPFKSQRYNKPDVNAANLESILQNENRENTYFPKNAVPDYVQMKPATQTYNTVIANEDKGSWRAQARRDRSKQVVDQKDPLKNITNQDAKNIIALVGAKTPNKISAKQIENTFSPSTIVGLIATSKNASELKNKIDAGIIVRNIQKKNMFSIPNKENNRRS